MQLIIFLCQYAKTFKISSKHDKRQNTLHCKWVEATAVFHFNILQSQITTFKQVDDICFECMFMNAEQPTICQT